MRQRMPWWLQGLEEKQLKTSNMSTVAVRSQAVQRIDADEVLKLLKEGYTRYRKDDKGYGSIQEKYNLSHSAVIRLFKTPSLKFKKTVVPGFVLERPNAEEFDLMDDPELKVKIERELEKQGVPEEDVLFS